jgi:hypothetical protein
MDAAQKAAAVEAYLLAAVEIALVDGSYSAESECDAVWVQNEWHGGDFSEAGQAPASYDGACTNNNNDVSCQCSAGAYAERLDARIVSEPDLKVDAVTLCTSFAPSPCELTDAPSAEIGDECQSACFIHDLNFDQSACVNGHLFNEFEENKKKNWQLLQQL